MEKHVMRVSYLLCLLCAVLALITRGLSVLNLPNIIFANSGLNAVSYHAFLDGVLLFFMTSLSTASYVWVKKQLE